MIIKQILTAKNQFIETSTQTIENTNFFVLRFLDLGTSFKSLLGHFKDVPESTGDNRVIAVMGGFHLKEIDECTSKTIEYLKNNVLSVYLAHCTSDIVCQEFEKQIPDKTHIIKTGMIYEFDKEHELVER